MVLYHFKILNSIRETFEKDYNIKISGNDKKRMWAMISTDDYSFKFISSKFSLTKLVIENSSKTFKLEEEDISSYRTIEKQLELLEEIKSFFEN